MESYFCVVPAFLVRNRTALAALFWSGLKFFTKLKKVSRLSIGLGLGPDIIIAKFGMTLQRLFCIKIGTDSLYLRQSKPRISYSLL